MSLLISDACVFIDIEAAQLTHAMFSLPYQFAIPDVIYEEELSDRHPHLLALGLISKTIRSELIAEVYDLKQKHKKLSLYDCFALILAKDEKTRLLTGDRALREMAKKWDVEVHGTVWLIQQMMEHKVIQPQVVRIALQRMREAGSRLPWNEVDAWLDHL